MQIRANPLGERNVVFASNDPPGTMPKGDLKAEVFFAGQIVGGFNFESDE